MRSTQSAFVVLLVVSLMKGVWSTPTSYTTQAYNDIERKGASSPDSETLEPITETSESESLESTTEDENATTDEPTTELIEIELQIEADWKKFLV